MKASPPVMFVALLAVACGAAPTERRAQLTGDWICTSDLSPSPDITTLSSKIDLHLGDDGAGSINVTALMSIQGFRVDSRAHADTTWRVGVNSMLHEVQGEPSLTATVNGEPFDTSKPQAEFQKTIRGLRRANIVSLDDSRLIIRNDDKSFDCRKLA